jgi:hypothetical protein
MAIVTASTLTRSPTSERSYDYSDQASITATPVTGDLWNFLVIPAGTEIRSITIQNADLGTAAPLDLGFAPVDGSTGDADAFLDDYAAGTAAASGVHYLLAAPVRVEKDSFLQAVFGTINTGASGAITVLINGKLLGPK